MLQDLQLCKEYVELCSVSSLDCTMLLMEHVPFASCRRESRRSNSEDANRVMVLMDLLINVMAFTCLAIGTGVLIALACGVSIKGHVLPNR